MVDLCCLAIAQASGRAPDQLFNQPVNTNFLAQPIRKFDHLKYRDWWFHGVVDAKPDAVMELPVGESINIEHACNKAWTTLGSNPDRLDIVGDIPCDINNRGGKAVRIGGCTVVRWFES